MYPKIIVIMATFNGYPYILEQVNSILEQKDVSLELHIFDDNSAETTLQLLRSLEDKRIFLHYSANRKGPQFRFINALSKFDDAEFVAWADQDDIWEPNKLQNAIEKIQNLKTAAMYCSNVYIYNQLESHQETRHPQETSFSAPRLPLSFFENSAMGCTIVLNKESKTLVRREFDTRIIMHDWFALIVNLSCGKVIFDENAYMNYRIHDQQLVGLKSRKSLKSIIGFTQIKLAINQAKFVWGAYGIFMNNEAKQDYLNFLNAINSPRMSRERIKYFAFSGNKFRSSFLGNNLFVIKLLLI